MCVFVLSTVYYNDQQKVLYYSGDAGIEGWYVGWELDGNQIFALALAADQVIYHVYIYICIYEKQYIALVIW